MENISTIASAIDHAIKTCNKEFPGAEVYGARIKFSEKAGLFTVELDVQHFSAPLRYLVAP
jgi:hypothetical protein